MSGCPGDQTVLTKTGINRNTPKLGFGFMRLPRLSGSDEYDMDQICHMVDVFMEAMGSKEGAVPYFDTAFVYDGGRSEEALRKSLMERYPRESYTIATKLNAGMPIVTGEAFAKEELLTSLERLGTDYVDYYLLHAVQKGNIDKYNGFRLWEYILEQKAAGRIRHIGFSFHDTPEMLDELLTLHPEAEFVQLQLNYADWEAPNVRSRGVYETARRHGKPIIVMEPVKGGTLANPPAAVRDVFAAADPAASPASWAIRYAASLPGILTVLSGMTTLAQVEDNVSYMKEFQPLGAAELAVVARAQEILASQDSIPCTGCRYCVDGCTMSIPIPDIFNASNRETVFGDHAGAAGAYARETKGKGTASSCVHCLQCESVCPQHLPITDLLKEASQRFD